MRPDALVAQPTTDPAESHSDRPARGLTVRDVARRYRVSPDRVRAWIRRGELAALNTADVRCGKPRWVVTPDALDRFERGRQAAAPPRPARRQRLRGVRDYFPLPGASGGRAAQ